MEAGVYARTSAGTPQGGVISPLLANIYLHEVLDAWFEQEARPHFEDASHWSATRTML